MIRVRVRYTGRVQGVGFRATAASVARAESLTGWVRNEPDGSVVLEAQGEPEAVDRFLDRLGARMQRVIRTQDAATIEPIGGEVAFEIRF